MRIPLACSFASLVGATDPPSSTIVSINSATGDVDISQLPAMLTKAGYTPDPEVASFLDTAEITTLEYVHSQVVHTPPHTIDSEALCNFVKSASSKLLLRSECAADANGEAFGGREQSPPKKKRANSAKLDMDLHVNDPDAVYQKHLKWMNMGKVWRLAFPHVKRKVAVAVIDSGINWNDPDFAPLKGRVKKKSGSYLDGGWNFITDSSIMTFVDSHGTNVCKILAAKGNNSVGIAGVAPNVTLVPLQILDENGKGPLSRFLAALHMAIDLEVDIVSMSLGYYLSGAQARLMQRGLRAAQERGIALVSAIGYASELREDDYPCRYGGPLALCVAYMQDDKTRNVLHTNSGWGRRVDVAAYGTNIFTGRDENGELRYFNGSSAATPIVTALFAMLLSMDIDPMVAKRLILNNVDPVELPSILEFFIDSCTCGELGVPDWKVYSQDQASPFSLASERSVFLRLIV
ncbi:hypothetical protein FOL46_002517 [Perkinsus olseni]|uniref:subtilisin n=1 Tax=Perkinsus olseni TaxID=32597 RepID=A0A7J6M7J1_PEROL|nr:hypothetical protein FOL46_002517 [Perkinsus olseni]